MNSFSQIEYMHELEKEAGGYQTTKIFNNIDDS
jgi:hypothetical protein